MLTQMLKVAVMIDNKVPVTPVAERPALTSQVLVSALTQLFIQSGNQLFVKYCKILSLVYVLSFFVHLTVQNSANA